MKCPFNTETIEIGKPTTSRNEMRPYTGKIVGGTWNTTAFYASTCSKMEKRIKRVKQLITNMDFFSLQETHSTPARALAIPVSYTHLTLPTILLV